jgi:hypothetical protein
MRAHVLVLRTHRRVFNCNLSDVYICVAVIYTITHGLHDQPWPDSERCLFAAEQKKYARCVDFCFESFIPPILLYRSYLQLSLY